MTQNELKELAFAISRQIDGDHYRRKGEYVGGHTILDCQPTDGHIDLYTESPDGEKARFHITVEPAPIQPGWSVAGRPVAFEGRPDGDHDHQSDDQDEV